MSEPRATVRVASLGPFIMRWLALDWPEGREWEQFVAPPAPPEHPSSRIYWLDSLSASWTSEPVPQSVHDLLMSRPGWSRQFISPGDAMIVGMMLKARTTDLVAFRMGSWKWSAQTGWEATFDE